MQELRCVEIKRECHYHGLKYHDPQERGARGSRAPSPICCDRSIDRTDDAAGRAKAGRAVQGSPTPVE